MEVGLQFKKMINENILVHYEWWNESLYLVC